MFCTKLQLMRDALKPIVNYARHQRAAGKVRCRRAVGGGYDLNTFMCPFYCKYSQNVNNYPNRDTECIKQTSIMLLFYGTRPTDSLAHLCW